MSASSSVRVRFAPSPTGYLHVGSARTFIFNWLFARHTGGTMILRLDDTDVERNTQESVASIFDGLRWLGLNLDEEYKQSERLELHRKAAQAIFEKGLAYRDFTPPSEGERDRSAGPWLYNLEMREMSRAESDRRAAAGGPFALRFRVPRDSQEPVRFADAVYGEQAKSMADIEDFALLRSDGMPTYHMASCADDADLRISHIIRGQDHLTNTFKHILIFRALAVEPPQFAHLPLLVAPDGAKLSKRKHGPVVSVTTYAEAGFLPQAFINFLCLLGWSPKDDREYMPLDEIVKIFSLENINRANAVINFKEPAATPEEMFDPKAIWLNSQYIHNLPEDELAKALLPIVRNAGYDVDLGRMKQITPLIRERIKLLKDVLTAADFFFVKELPPYDPALLIPQKGDAAMARQVLERARDVLAKTEFTHDALDQALRTAAKELGLKAGQMFTPIRVAVTGRTAAPPLFETLSVMGRETALSRLEQAIRRARNIPDCAEESSVRDTSRGGEVFISYSWDDEKHVQRVLALSNRLRSEGIDCVLDQYEESPAEGWPRWMDRKIAAAERVLVVCTETYYRRVMGLGAESQAGLGVKWEGGLIYQHLYNAGSNNRKFMPVLLAESDKQFIPVPLQGATYYRLDTRDGYDKLYFRLLGEPREQKPKLGSRRPLPQKQVKTDMTAYLASPINVPLWDRARWKGTLFMSMPGLPLCFGLAFLNEDPARQIFEEWRQRYGSTDRYDELRISIIEGDISGELPGYSVHVGIDPENLFKRYRDAGLNPNFDSSLLVSISRIHRMNPKGESVYLKWFKQSYGQVGEYMLIPAVIKPDASQFKPLVELGIRKRAIAFRRVEDIKPGDIDGVIFRRGQQPPPKKKRKSR